MQLGELSTGYIHFLEPKQNKEETSVSKSMSDVRKTFPRYLVFVLDHPSLSLTPVWSETTQMKDEKIFRVQDGVLP